MSLDNKTPFKIGRSRQHATLNKGFTLIEILIALTVFAILASITSSVLYNAFTTRTRVNEQSKRLNELQLAISILQLDTHQAVSRAIRIGDMQLSPPFMGKQDYIEFTRDGDINPGGVEKRSTLKRVGYACAEGGLMRRTWTSLDAQHHSYYEEKLLIKNLSACHFGFLNQSAQVLSEWKEEALTIDQKKEPLPKAIQMNLTLLEHGEINLLFPLLEAVYAPI